MNGLQISGAVVLAVLLSGACSSPDAGGGSVAKSEFTSRYINTICNNIGDCCKSAGYVYDTAGCRSSLTQSWNPSTSGTYQADTGARCLQLITQAVKTCGAIGMETDTVCRSVYVGSKATGEPCNVGECAPVDGADAWCGDPEKTGQKVCQLVRHAKVGDACGLTCNGDGGSCHSVIGAASDVICYRNEGVYCAGNGLCAPLVASGQACGTSFDCVDGAYCETGVCAPKQPRGGDCSSQDACVDGTYCAGGTCAQLKPIGAACAGAEECLGADCSQGVCKNDYVTPALCSGQEPQPAADAGTG